jgi:hypothetical protein
MSFCLNLLLALEFVNGKRKRLDLVAIIAKRLAESGRKRNSVGDKFPALRYNVTRCVSVPDISWGVLE